LVDTLLLQWDVPGIRRSKGISDNNLLDDEKETRTVVEYGVSALHSKIQSHSNGLLHIYNCGKGRMVCGHGMQLQHQGTAIQYKNSCL